MVGLPRSIIKKYGVTKKAWSVFRSGKKTTTKKYKVTKMAKRYRKSSSGIKGMMSGMTGQIVGVGGYILFESFIEPKLLQMANISNPLVVNVAELGLGLYLSRKSGIVGNIGKAAVIINAYQILYPMLNKVSSSNSGQDIAYQY